MGIIDKESALCLALGVDGSESVEERMKESMYAFIRETERLEMQYEAVRQMSGNLSGRKRRRRVGAELDQIAGELDEYRETAERFRRFLAGSGE